MKIFYTFILFLALLSVQPARAEDIINAGPAADTIDPEEPLYKDKSILEATDGGEEAASAEPAVSLDESQKLLLATSSEDEPADVSSNAYVTFNGIDFDTLNSNMNSLFFSREQLDLLYSKIRKFKLSGNKASAIAGTSLGAASTKSEEEQKYKYITYYLSSILYPEDKDWTIWLNDSKLRKEQTAEQADYKILDVEERSVTLVYKTAVNELALNSPSFKTKLTKLNVPESSDGYNWDYASADSAIKIDSNLAAVRVKLKMNQTFSLYDCEIREGRYSPAGATTAAAEGGATPELGDDVLEPNAPSVVEDVSKEKPKDIDALKMTSSGNSADASAPEKASDAEGVVVEPAKAENGIGSSASGAVVNRPDVALPQTKK